MIFNLNLTEPHPFWVIIAFKNRRLACSVSLYSRSSANIEPRFPVIGSAGLRPRFGTNILRHDRSSIFDQDHHMFNFRQLGLGCIKRIVLVVTQGVFSSFFEGTARQRLHSQHKGLNLCFCRQARYFRGFAGFAKLPKIVRKQQQIRETAVPGPT